MALTADQTAYFSKRLGSAFDVVNVESRLTRLGGPGNEAAAAAEVLEERLATLLTRPLSFTIPGDYSEDQSKNVSELRDMLATAQDEAGLTPAQSTLRSVRVASRWSR